MAIYTTLFLCEPEKLLAGFPEWKPALAQPVRREVRNPFTGEEMIIESRNPDWPEEEEEVSMPQFQAVEINMPYEQYLEARLPDFVRQFPHWASKGLTCVEFNPLLQVLGLNAELDMPIYSPPSSGNVVEEFPMEFLSALSAADLAAVSMQWAAAMSTPEHTHSVSGVRLYDDWTATYAHEILNPILGLARESTTSSQRLYLLTEV